MSIGRVVVGLATCAFAALGCADRPTPTEQRSFPPPQFDWVWSDFTVEEGYVESVEFSEGEADSVYDTPDYTGYYACPNMIPHQDVKLKGKLFNDVGPWRRTTGPGFTTVSPAKGSYKVEDNSTVWDSDDNKAQLWPPITAEASCFGRARKILTIGKWDWYWVGGPITMPNVRGTYRELQWRNPPLNPGPGDWDNYCAYQEWTEDPDDPCSNWDGGSGGDDTWDDGPQPSEGQVQNFL